MTVQAAYKPQKPTLIDIPISNNGGRVIIEAYTMIEPHVIMLHSAGCKHSDTIILELHAVSVVSTLSGTPTSPF